METHFIRKRLKIISGQFAFTTSEAGNYLACFWIESGDKGVGANVILDWKIGIAAKDWDSVAEKEKIEGVELELKKLEAQVQAIHQDLLYLKSRNFFDGCKMTSSCSFSGDEYDDQVIEYTTHYNQPSPIGIMDDESEGGSG